MEPTQRMAMVMKDIRASKKSRTGWGEGGIEYGWVGTGEVPIEPGVSKGFLSGKGGESRRGYCGNAHGRDIDDTDGVASGLEEVEGFSEIGVVVIAEVFTEITEGGSRGFYGQGAEKFKGKVKIRMV